MNGHRWSSSNKNVQLTWSMKQKKNLTTKHVKVIKQEKFMRKDYSHQTAILVSFSQSEKKEFFVNEKK